MKSMTTTATYRADLIQSGRILETVHRETISWAKQGKGLQQKTLAQAQLEVHVRHF